MTNTKKVLLLILCAVFLIGTTVMGTLAWLTDRETVTNTMTVGKVDITVDEAKVDLNGIAIPDAERVQTNEYKMIPGQIYTKDPTMTVAGDSEEAYVRMLLTISCKNELDAIFAPDGVDLTTIFKGYEKDIWVFTKETVGAANTVTYEFRYKETVKPNGENVVLPALFTSFTVPGELDGEDLESIKNLTITVEGHAIQAAGFDTDDLAWAAFNTQNNA